MITMMMVDGWDGMGWDGFIGGSRELAAQLVDGDRKEDYKVQLNHAAERSTSDIMRYTKHKDHTARPQDCINALDIVLRQVGR